ncbi:MAG: HEPN domain-containing protein [Nanoarchaeota archaeon]|nr:HEPN domain-containing protein [Nanoarchaeota archaeon]MBU0977219.1 HEPN domain-containing protein [Nanoarchaeota archaeon]
MNSKKFDWHIWLEEPKEVEDSFNFYLKKETIKKETETRFLPVSHLNKAEYNLTFTNFLAEQQRYYDWIIVGCYYTIYHAALSLIAKKGFSSKNHLATLCALIKFYVVQENTLSKEEIELVSRSSLEKEEVSYFAYAKEKRETASYGLSEEFNKAEAEDLLKKTVQFLNKCREILEG